MTCLLPRIIGVLAIISILLTNQASAYCSRCVKIEEERAQQQKVNPQPWNYYDDQVQEGSQNSLNSQKKEENKPKTFVQNESVKFLTTSYLAQNESPSQLLNRNKTHLQTSNFPSDLPLKEDFFEEEEVIIPTQSDIQTIESLEKVKRTYFSGKADHSNRVDSSSYSTLLTIFKTKFFLETLDGSFTLLIPTNEALRKLPPGMLVELTRAENQEQLATLISNHVIAKKLLKQDFETFKNHEVKAISGRNLTIRSENNQLTIDGAHVLRTEPGGYDGVIYVIDKVLIP